MHFEPFENRAYDMSYACLLIPRDPEHLLTGKVADFIQKSIQNVCIAFGWHLMQVQVQPEYFQWVMSATVGTPPSKCIHTIREQTSKGILATFQQFRASGRLSPTSGRRATWCWWATSRTRRASSRSSSS